MSFLNRLFKQKAPETLEQKIANLSTYDQSQLLTCLGSEQPDAYVCAAISRINYCPTLLNLAINSSASAPVKGAARRRIGDLLDSGALTVAQLSNDLNDKNLLLQLCGYSNEAGLALVAEMTAPEMLLATAQNGATTQIRQAAAEKITAREDLEQLARHAKLKDKSVYKIVKAKLEVFKGQKAIEKEVAEQVNSVCGQAEQLTKRNIDDIFYARKAQIEKAWTDLAEQASEQAQKRFQSALAICNQKLEDIRMQLNAEVERKAAILHAKKDVLNAIESLQKLLSRLYTHPADEQLASEISQSHAVQQKVFAEAQEQGLDVTAEKKKAEQLNIAVQALLQQIKDSGPLEKLIDDLKSASQETGASVKTKIQQIAAYSKHLADHQVPEIIGHSSHAINEWTQTVKVQSEAIKNELRSTAELLRKGDWAISNGHVGRARAILRDLDAAVTPIKDLPNHLAAKIDDFKAAVQKLGDWHEFAVTPKKESLVKQMQELIGSNALPQPLADKIQKLQDQWKELCKGGQNQDDTLWQEFHAAAQQAYEPCKTYFEKQSQEREHNSQQRKTLITQLHEYLNAYDWNAADWKTVEKTLRISRDAWQSYWPVPRKDIKELQAEFDQIMDQLYGKLNAAQEHNRTLKQAIVDQAEKLLGQTDTNAAIESAKTLQAQWQRIGQCKRKDDQVLWKIFRAHCDAVFEKRSQENDALREERDQAKTKAIELLDQLQQFSVLVGEDFFAARTDIERVSNDFKGIGELPKNDSKALFDRFNKITEELQTKTQSERLALNQQQWRNAFSFADELRSLEIVRLKAEGNPDQAAELQERIKAISKWPGNTREIITTRLENLPSITQAILDEAEQRLRLLCIRSEIIKGVDTPEEDKSLRMRYQVELLQQDGLAKASASTKQDMQQLLEAWLAQPGGSNATYLALLSRFCRCWGLDLK